MKKFEGFALQINRDGTLLIVIYCLHTWEMTLYGMWQIFENSLIYINMRVGTKVGANLPTYQPPTNRKNKPYIIYIYNIYI